MFDVIHQIIDRVHGWRTEEERDAAHAAVEDYRQQSDVADPADPADSEADSTDSGTPRKGGKPTSSKDDSKSTADTPLFDSMSDKSSK